jgi:integrase
VSDKFIKVAPYLYLSSETGFFFVRRTFRRLRIPDLFSSTKEKRLNKAKVIAEQKIAEHMAQYLGAESSMARVRSGKRISEVIDEILITKTPTKRKGTQEMHKHYLGELRKEWGMYDITRFSSTQWAAWLQKFKTTKERKTFDDYVKHMNLILRHAYGEKYCSHLTILKNTDVKKEDTGRVYTHDEVAALWSVMNEETRDQFTLSYECMMRLREGLHLTWDRVNFETSVITLKAEHVKTGSKTGKGRSFKASPNTMARLKARFKDRASDKWVFPSPIDPDQPVNQNKTAWNEAKTKAKIKGKARWHDLRHTAITRSLMEAGMSPIHVSEYAGVSIRTIQRVYLHSTAEQTAEVSLAVSVGNAKQRRK